MVVNKTNRLTFYNAILEHLRYKSKNSDKVICMVDDTDSAAFSKMVKEAGQIGWRVEVGLAPDKDSITFLRNEI